jgi:hypothetical protein
VSRGWPDHAIVDISASTATRTGSGNDSQLREWPPWVASGLMHRSRKALFDHFVGLSEQQARQLQAELPCSFLVHGELKFRWELDRQFGRISTT